MEPTNKKRTSMQNPQYQKELRNINPQDLFKGIDGFNIHSMARLSGNSLRGSLQRKTGIPTPTIKGKPGSSSKIPTGLGSNSRRKISSAPRNPGSAVASSSRTFTKPKGVPNFKGPGAFPFGRGLIGANLTTSSLNSTRRKSKSYESLLQTPAFTPAGRSRSKSPGPGVSSSRRRGFNECFDQVKNIKVSKEKKHVVEMSKYVFDFLETQNCLSRPAQWKDLASNNNISGAKYVAMVKFVASFFVGDSFSNTAGDDAEKIMDLAKLLKYSGQLSKSHLKIATAPHAWPAHLTFLTWLCCRAQSLLTLPAERKTVSELDCGFAELAFPSYLNLFPLYFVGNMSEEDVDRELENFRERVCEMHTVEVSKSKDELILAKEEKLQEFDKLYSETDSTIKEYKDRFDAELRTHGSIIEKIRAAENRCKHFSDFNHLLIERERLSLDIKAKMKELAHLRQQIESQSLSQQDAFQMRANSQNMKNQLETAIALNRQLSMELEKQTQFVNNSQKKFYEVCKQFSVVERYNDVIQYLNLRQYVVPTNPFEPEAVQNWLQEVLQTLRKAEVAVNDYTRKIVNGLEQQNKMNSGLTDQYDKLNAQTMMGKAKLEELERELKTLEEEHETNSQNEQTDVDTAKEDLRKEVNRYNVFVRNVAEWSKARHQWDDRLQGFLNRREELKLKVGEEYKQIILAEEEALKFAAGCTREAQRLYYDFYAELGIELPESDEELVEK